MTGKSGLRRIFVAIDLSDDARIECASHIDELRRRFPKARIGWERLEKLHITLKFLGPVDDTTLTKLDKKITQAASALSSGRLRLSSPGIFPNEKRPRVFWIGIDDLSTFAADAYRRVEDVAVGLGFDADDRRFTPHITIGRVRDPVAAREAADAHLKAHIEPVEFNADALVLYESKLLPTGSVYTVVSRFKTSAS